MFVFKPFLSTEEVCNSNLKVRGISNIFLNQEALAAGSDMCVYRTSLVLILLLTVNNERTSKDLIDMLIIIIIKKKRRKVSLRVFQIPTILYRKKKEKSVIKTSLFSFLLFQHIVMMFNAQRGRGRGSVFGSPHDSVQQQPIQFFQTSTFQTPNNSAFQKPNNQASVFSTSNHSAFQASNHQASAFQPPTQFFL